MIYLFSAQCRYRFAVLFPAVHTALYSYSCYYVYNGALVQYVEKG